MSRLTPVVCVVFLAAFSPVRADEVPARYRPVVTKGLDYLARIQHRDGHWEANGGQYQTAMTALAGMAMLMEGSTVREGKYADRIRRAVDWFMARSQKNGLLGTPNSEGGRYMYGHGFGLLFLASVYGEEEDGGRRKQLEDILTRAVVFTGRAQTQPGGWGYVSAADGSDFDEGSVTITQVQALRAARNAGIVVPKEIITRAQDYLKQCTNGQGGVIYSLKSGGGGARPPLTAAAVACIFNSGEYNSPLAKQWLQFCQQNIPVDKSGRDSFGHWEYTHYYYAQAIYTLGEDGYAKLFRKEGGQGLRWTKYREITFDYIASRQAADGSWNFSGIGPVYTTSLLLTILQLDNGILPIYQR